MGRMKTPVRVPTSSDISAITKTFGVLVRNARVTVQTIGPIVSGVVNGEPLSTIDVIEECNSNECWVSFCMLEPEWGWSSSFLPTGHQQPGHHKRFQLNFEPVETLIVSLGLFSLLGGGRGLSGDVQWWCYHLVLDRFILRSGRR